MPDAVASDAIASALLKGMTAHYLIKSVYPVQPEDTVLVHAGAGGVGLILTQWATSIGTKVITTASTPEKAELSRQAGAVEVLDYPDDPAEFGAKIRDLTDGRGVAAVYDGVGKSTFDASLASLAVRGTLALFGAASGPVPPVDPQRLNAAGSVFLTRPNLAHFTRTADEFAWRAGELMDAIADRGDHHHRQRALPAGRGRAGAPRSAGPQDGRLDRAGALAVTPGVARRRDRRNGVVHSHEHAQMSVRAFRGQRCSSVGSASAESTASAQNTTAR